MDETWIDIPGYEGLYQCSTGGRVRSLDRFVRSKLNSQKLCKGQILKPKTNSNGYNVIALRDGHTQKWLSLSRLIFQSFNDPTNLQVDHINEIKTDNRLVNLQALSSYDNNIKSKRHNKTSRFPGVHLYSKGKWRAQISIKSKKIGLGYFTNEEDAYHAYLKARPI